MKISLTSLAALLLFLLTWVNLPTPMIDRGRQKVSESLAPFWQQARAKSELKPGEASVIFREPASWSTCCWIDQGYPLAEIGSPVLAQGSLVGVVDLVGDHISRVRLVTDAKVVVAVEIARGFPQREELKNCLYQSSLLLSRQENLFATADEKAVCVDFLAHLAEKIEAGRDDPLSLRGELKGAAEPLWRSYRSRLQGVGFHIEGRQKDLLAPGDLLVTSGLDGVFPKGLRVGVIDQVDPWIPGDYIYKIKAIPCVKSLATLDRVEVLPPLPR